MTYSRFLFIAAALLWAAPVNALQCLNDYAGTTGCAGNSQAAGDCQTLGYSTENVEGCKHYIYCPFNTAYKICANKPSAEENKCAGYTLSSCPTGGICSSCEQKYKLDSCRFGWTQNGSACDINPCTGYTLLSCPVGISATCISCQSGDTTRYKLDNSRLP